MHRQGLDAARFDHTRIALWGVSYSGPGMVKYHVASQGIPNATPALQQHNAGVQGA